MSDFLLGGAYPLSIKLGGLSVSKLMMGNTQVWPRIVVSKLIQITFDSIANVPVSSATSLSNWNTFFNLPTNGTAFTSVEVTGNTVKLIGGENIKLKYNIFESSTHLLSFVDEGCITTAGNYCFNRCTAVTSFSLPALTTAGAACFDDCTVATSFSLPALTTAGNGCFQGCTAATSFSLPALTTAGNFCFSNCTGATSFNLLSCISLGVDVSNNNVFLNITGKNISLTIPSGLMVCNSGGPDGDITYLQAHNAVTITRV